MQSGSMEAISNTIQRVGSVLSRSFSSFNLYKNTQENEETALENVSCDYQYGQSNNILHKKIADLEEQLKNLRDSANNGHIRNSIFKDECETVKSNTTISLLLIDEIKKIVNNKNTASAESKRHSLEFIINEINENSLKIQTTPPIDFASSEKVLTVFVTIGVALWTYLSESKNLDSSSLLNKSVPFLLNLLPFATHATEFTIFQIFKFRNEHIHNILKVYKELLPELSVIKEILYKEEINTALSTIKDCSEQIMAKQAEHLQTEQGMENSILHAIEKLSGTSGATNEIDITKDKIMCVLHENMPLKHQVFKILFQQGENIDAIYKAFDSCMHTKYTNFSPVLSNLHRSHTLRLAA